MDYGSEIRQLEAEGEMPIMDLIASLPSDIMPIPPPTPASLQGEGLEEEKEGEGEKREEEEGEKREDEEEGEKMEEVEDEEGPGKPPPSPIKRVTRSVNLITQVYVIWGCGLPKL